MRLRTILVALDSSSRSGSVLRVAGELADKARAELRALYVEEVEWFEASKFNFSQQISSYTGSLIPFSERHIAQESRALGATIEKLFVELSKQLQIKYSYQSVRGIVSEKLMEAAAGSDMIIIGRTGRYGHYSSGPGNTARYLAEKSTKPVLVWNSTQEWPRQFIGLCGLPVNGVKVIRWTMELGQILDKSVRLFFSGEDGLAESWETTLEDINGELEYPIEKIRKVSEVHSDLTVGSLQFYRNELFVVQRNNLEIPPGEFLEKLPNSVLFI